MNKKHFNLYIILSLMFIAFSVFLSNMPFGKMSLINFIGYTMFYVIIIAMIINILLYIYLLKKR